MELRKQSLDFALLVRMVAANFESGERRRIHFRGMNVPVPLEADPNQMKKVLYNLLANAFKFSDPDKGQVWMRLSSRSIRSHWRWRTMASESHPINWNASSTGLPKLKGVPHGVMREPASDWP